MRYFLKEVNKEETQCVSWPSDISLFLRMGIHNIKKRCNEKLTRYIVAATRYSFPHFKKFFIDMLQQGNACVPEKLIITNCLSHKCSLLFLVT